MKRCQHCNVAVVGQVDTCPLCQCSLDKTGEPSQDIFPASLQFIINIAFYYG